MKHGGSLLLTKVGTFDNPLRIAVFFSGSGTGMNALLNHQNNAKCIHKTVLCVTDKEDAGGIQYAERHDVPVLVETLDTSLPRDCLLYTSPSPRDGTKSRMPSSA